MSIKSRLTIEQKAAALIKMAEEIYEDHFGELRTGVVVTENAQHTLDAAVFGFVYAQTLNEDVNIREVAYTALQQRFGWSDEYIATSVIGG